MKNDTLRRREALALLGAAGVVALTGCGDDAGGSGDEGDGGGARTDAACNDATSGHADGGGDGDATGHVDAGGGGIDDGGASAVDAGADAADSAVIDASVPTDAGALSCVVRPAQTEGPYFVDEKLLRADIRTDPANGAVSDGALLRLKIGVRNVNGSKCTAAQGVLVDVWQADAAGTYSDVVDTNGLFNTKGKKYLRGYLVTDANGWAEFVTIYPGWYTGRTVHIHFKIRTNPDGAVGTEFTSQLYFDDTLTDQVFAKAPYAAKGARTTRNTQDGIFNQGGSQLLLDVTADGAGGYQATFEIGLK